MATTGSSESVGLMVLSRINKRLRNLRKKQRRIILMEESLAQGKTLNIEQLEVLSTKSSIMCLIKELENLTQPLSVAFTQGEGEDIPNLEGHDSGDNQLGPVEEVKKDEFKTETCAEVVLFQHEQVKPEIEVEHDERDVEFEQPNGQYQNERGGLGGGSRGYSNGCGGRGRGGGSYRNFQNHFYDQPGKDY